MTFDGLKLNINKIIYKAFKYLDQSILIDNDATDTIYYLILDSLDNPNEDLDLLIQILELEIR